VVTSRCFTLSFVMVAWGGFSCAHSAPAETPMVPAAPPAKCEIALPVWCIREGAYEIVSQFSKHNAYRRVWIIRGFFKPSSPLIVREPYGCRQGLSDQAEALTFDKHIKWGGKEWNRMTVQLKKDGSCNIELLVPPFSEDPTGEAFFGGLALVQRCMTTSCDGDSLGPLRGRFEMAWRDSRE